MVSEILHSIGSDCHIRDYEKSAIFYLAGHPMRVIGIIPARLESIRLPRKLLLDGTGKPLIRHTYDSAYDAVVRGYLDDLYIATDSVELAHVCMDFAKVYQTGPHTCGTDRIADAVTRYRLGIDHNTDIVVNIQGDEPEIDPEHIKKVVDLVKQSPRVKFSSLAQPLDPKNLEEESVVKVMLTPLFGYAVHFFRSYKQFQQKYPNIRPSFLNTYQHIGIYAYSVEALRLFARTSKTEDEIALGLEQMRALSIGLNPLVGIVNEHKKGIDTQDEYDKFVERWKQQHT